MDRYQVELAKTLLDAGVVRTFADNGGVWMTMKSGQQTPIYIDLRGPVLQGPVLRPVMAALVELVPGQSLFAGPPSAGLPLVGALVMYLELVNKRSARGLWWRSEQKDHGTGNTIEGVYTSGEEVVVIDDVCTGGLAKIEALVPLNAAGLTVKQVVVLVDREQGGRQVLEHRGITLSAPLTLRNIVDVASADGIWAPDVSETISRYLDEAAQQVPQIVQESIEALDK